MKDRITLIVAAVVTVLFFLAVVFAFICESGQVLAVGFFD